MKYDRIRGSIKSGDQIVFSHYGWRTWKDIKAQFVRMFTQSEYCHTATAWVIGKRVLVIEHVIPKVRIYPLSKLGPFYHIKTNVQWTKAVEDYALSTIGHDYSQWAAIKAFFHKLQPGSTEECAALSKSILAKAGLELDCRDTPDEVVLALQKLNKQMSYVEN